MPSNNSFTLPTRPDHLQREDSPTTGLRLPVTLETHRHRTPYAVLALLALLASAFVALSAAGPAAAQGSQTNCGKKVLDDWYDNGRVDKLYPLHCYEDAIDAIPKDLDPYVNAREVINRALQSALNDELAPGGCDPTPDGDGDDCRQAGSPSPGGGQSGTGGSDGGGSPEASPEVDSSGASSIPVPLMVLGGMSVALLAAGGLGYLSRRRLNAESGEPGDDFPV